ncbi:MAG: allantoinase AllB [Chloroflexota bacterium]|nr:allantoinase AllB [Chloroflexota bacterium]
MPEYDLLVRGGHVVTGAGVHLADIAIDDGVFVAIGTDLGGAAIATIDASGAFVLPGGIDPHVHFNDPGRTDWEGWDSGSRSLVAGGITTGIDMPLNASPPTLDRASFGAKVAAASGTSFADFALWGGLTPDNLDRLPELAEAGVVGFKAFMSRSGTEDFRHAGDDTLYQGMRYAASVGLPVAVHAENDAITADLARRARAEGRTAVRDYLDSRPVVAEVEAIGRAIALAEDTGCSLHIVHVSTGRGVTLVAGARERGVDVTCETCPHYLVFTDDDAERIGALAKCAPPLRDAETRDALWDALLASDIDLIASDHSPAPPSMKEGDDVFDNWGGISGCQHLLPVLLGEGQSRGLDLAEIARLTSGNAAKHFQLPGKGEIAVGYDADFSLVAAQEPAPLSGVTVHYRHRQSAWDTFPVSYRVRTCVLRGRIVFGDGAVGERPPDGRLLRPAYAGSGGNTLESR